MWCYDDDKTCIILKDGKPRSVKKVTGTRFAGVLGLNQWTTPFQMWCEITKVAQPPFEGNIYTQAGQAIEPKVIDWVKQGISRRTVSPEEYYGLRYNEVKYDFYPQHKRFGGMWDAKILNQKGETRYIVEIKTTKRAEDWIDHPPYYYLCQVLLYAYLEGIEDVILTCTILEDDDYNHPERFKVTDDNTTMWTFNTQTTQIPYNGFLYTIEELVDIVNDWYDAYIETGVSPEFDEVKDAEYLEILRTTHPEYDHQTDELIQELNELEERCEVLKQTSGINQLEKRMDHLKKGIKSLLMHEIDDTTSIVKYGGYQLKKNVRKVIDSDALKSDDLYDRYVKESVSYTLTKAKN